MARSEAKLRWTRPGDAQDLAPRLRAADVAEIFAGGRQPLSALNESLALSVVSGALELGGELAALFGVCPGPREYFIGPPAYEVAWCLTGSAVDRHPVAFARASRRMLRELLAAHPVLFAAIDARYEVAARWARWLGAEVRPAIPWGASGELFHPCFWRA